MLAFLCRTVSAPHVSPRVEGVRLRQPLALHRLAGTVVVEILPSSYLAIADERRVCPTVKWGPVGPHEYKAARVDDPRNFSSGLAAESVVIGILDVTTTRPSLPSELLPRSSYDDFESRAIVFVLQGVDAPAGSRCGTSDEPFLPLRFSFLRVILEVRNEKPHDLRNRVKRLDLRRSLNDLEGDAHQFVGAFLQLRFRHS